MDYHLAQINIARMVAPLDSPAMADFVANLDRINALAESVPGFIWRLKGEGNDATSLRPYEDNRIVVNMSVWESIDTLFQYAYYSGHAEVFRRRAEWFSKMTAPSLALWWMPAGHIPDVMEAKAKLDYIERHGPSPLAFTFRQRYTLQEMLATAV
jgi:uncharacterized protein DUF3291